MYKLNSCLPNKSYLVIGLIATTFVLNSTVHALKDDIEKPVHINADSVFFNQGKGLGVYEGNVSVVQGSLDVRAKKIEINAPDGLVTKIVATGDPVKFQQKMDDGKLTKGEAKRVVYQVVNKRIVLDGNAVITQSNDRFASNHIEYSISDGELKAGNKTATGKSRVKAVLYPVNESK